jgi:hypothetical protein
MKFRTTFKTPDAIQYALRGVPEEHQEGAYAVVNRFVRHEETVTIEFDTEAKTAVVVPLPHR